MCEGNECAISDHCGIEFPRREWAESAECAISLGKCPAASGMWEITPAVGDSGRRLRGFGSEEFRPCGGHEPAHRTRRAAAGLSGWSGYLPFVGSPTFFTLKLLDHTPHERLSMPLRMVAV